MRTEIVAGQIYVGNVDTGDEDWERASGSVPGITGRGVVSRRDIAEIKRVVVKAGNRPAKRLGVIKLGGPGRRGREGSVRGRICGAELEPRCRRTSHRRSGLRRSPRTCRC